MECIILFYFLIVFVVYTESRLQTPGDHGLGALKTSQYPDHTPDQLNQGPWKWNPAINIF